MKRYILFLMALLTCGSLLAQRSDVRVYEFEVGSFDKIKLLDDVNVIYRCLPDSAGYVRFEGTPEFGNAFIIKRSDNGTLKIQVNSEDLGDPRLPTLHIYSDFLVAVENSSKFDIFIESVTPCVEFKATQIGNGSIRIARLKATKVSASITTGNGSINIAGECDTASFKMLGAGLISADRLAAETVDCKIFGTGSIGCWPVDYLNVKGIGSTKIYYKGNPEIKKSGGGKLIHLPSADNEDFSAEEEED